MLCRLAAPSRSRLCHLNYLSPPTRVIPAITAPAVHPASRIGSTTANKARFSTTRGTMSSGIQTIFSKDAPPAVGPYSHAVKAGGFLYVSGSIPFDAAGNHVGASSGVGAQAEQVCKNLTAVLEAGGSSLDKVVKVTVFLVDLKDFAEVNAVYERYFAHKPARSCVAVAGLPKGVPVEMECVALA